MTALQLPGSLRPLVDGAAQVALDGITLGDALTRLRHRHPALFDRLLDGKGALRPYMNLFLNDEDVRGLQGLETALRDGDRVLVVPALAGG